MLLLQSQVLSVESVDTIDHRLDQLDLRVAQAVLVGNVISDASLAARLTTGSTGLKGQLFTPGLQSGQTLLGPSRQVNVNRGPHASSQVGGARVQVTVLLVQQEVFAGLVLDGGSDSFDTSGQTLKDSLNVSSCNVGKSIICAK